MYNAKVLIEEVFDDLNSIPLFFSGTLDGIPYLFSAEYVASERRIYYLAAPIDEDRLARLKARTLCILDCFTLPATGPVVRGTFLTEPDELFGYDLVQDIRDYLAVLPDPGVMIMLEESDE